MDSIKNYPWAEYFKVSEKDFIKWKLDKTEESFVFWSLQNNVINKHQYFDWAVEYYQIPFLEDMFFEQHLMTKKQWQQIKNHADWHKEMMPVAIWDDVVFIGCVDPIIKKNTFPFKHRLVLANSMTLQMTWRFTKKLSKTIQKEEDTMVSQVKAQISSTQDIQSVKTTNLKESDKKLNKQAFTLETPSETTHPLHNPITNQPSIQSKAEEPKNPPGIISIEDYKTKGQPQRPKTTMSFPEETENKRVFDSENNTFPERSYKDDNNIIMQDFKQRKIDESSFKGVSQITKLSTNTLYLKTEHNKSYEKLWKKTKPNFCTSMILKVKENKIYLFMWSGRMKSEQTNEDLADLNGHSLFKVVQRGHPYHGFVVDTPGNKTFFGKIGWESYPKHITAIPIKNENQELQNIFVGLSTSLLSKNKIKEVEQIIFDFFQSKDEQKLSKAA